MTDVKTDGAGASRRHIGIDNGCPPSARTSRAPPSTLSPLDDGDSDGAATGAAATISVRRGCSGQWREMGPGADEKKATGEQAATVRNGTELLLAISK